MASGEIVCRTVYGRTKSIPKSRLFFRTSVYGIICYKAHILLVKSRYSGLFAPPGGGVELGERLLDALQREVKEEAGIHIQAGGLAHFTDDFFYYNPKDLAMHSFLFYYDCQPVTYKLHEAEYVDDEAVELPQWIPIRDLTKSQLQQHETWVVDYLKNKRYE